MHDSIGPQAWATALPLVLVVPAVWLTFRRATGPTHRASLAFALAPVLVGFGFACWKINWWNTLDGMLLVLMVATTAAIVETAGGHFRRAWPVVVGLVLLPGGWQLAPIRDGGVKRPLGQTELMGLVERDLAHWLSMRTGAAGAVILGPPNETAALCYYGGLRGLATLDWENKEGFVAAARIASATTPEEAQELARRRELTHIIMPSWDAYFDEYARWGLGKVEGSFTDLLRHWALPSWLQPVPYQLPAVKELAGQSVIVLEVVDEQDDAVRFSREAEYFLEMGQLDLAAARAQTLRRYPADLSAVIARAQVELALNKADDFAQTIDLIDARLSRGGDRNLPWDRRVSLAFVLARSKRIQPARAQVRRCLQQINESRIRALTTTSLYRLQVLMHAFDLKSEDPKLRELALNLLPSELRGRFLNHSDLGTNRSARSRSPRGLSVAPSSWAASDAARSRA